MMFTPRVFAMLALLSIATVLAAPIADSSVEKRDAEPADYGNYGSYGKYGTYGTCGDNLDLEQCIVADSRTRDISTTGPTPSTASGRVWEVRYLRKVKDTKSTS